ncbi:S1 family peptidase [Streptomyces sp. NPDC004111]|uniref:S1 family peptidase n=1 Tax=Streptomyces sp. NPDC004111 TaxID=3364690 RepID=UPI0036859E2D
MRQRSGTPGSTPSSHRPSRSAAAPGAAFVRRPARRGRAGIAVLALVGALLSTGALSTSAGAAPVAPAGSAAGAPASSGLIAAMQRDLGLTAAQARARLDAETTARATEPRARAAAGAGYAGAWFDTATHRLTVAVADAARADAVRATGATVRTVTHSARTLATAHRAIDALKAPVAVTSWGVDPRANSVVVKVVAKEARTPAVRAFLAAARAAGPVQVQETTAAARPLAAGTVGGDPFYTGNVRCSIGFSVHGGFVTAGHCGGAGQSVRGWDNSAIGSIQASSFPGDDMAWVNVGNGWWTTPVVLGWGTIPDRLVRGSGVAPIGTSVCRSGSTSHWHCGQMSAYNETVNYSDGRTVYGLTRTSVCAEPGDSGGSFISGDQAQGVTSGGYGNCSSGGETWFQPVNEILARYGLSLVTS